MRNQYNLRHSLRHAWLLLAACLLLFSGYAQAEIDEMETQMLTNYKPFLRWDNVYSKPEWITGKKPYYSFKNKMYQVTLYPGESVTVRVQKYQRARLLRKCQKLSPLDVNFDVSDGSGLFARIPGTVSWDGQSLLGPFALGTPQLVRISRPSTEVTPLEVGVFVSRYIKWDNIAPYRKIIYFKDRSVRMSHQKTAGMQPYWYFKPGQSRQVKVIGPRRYTFESRMLYPKTESRQMQTYQIRTMLDGKPLRVMNHETTQESAAPMFVSFHSRVVSRLDKGYVDVPAGTHTLEITPSTTVFGRLVMLKEPDFLIPYLNAPSKTTGDVLRYLKPNRSRLWGFTPKEIREGVHDKTLSPSEKEAIALRLVRDNSHREGGLIAAAMMDESAEHHPDYPLVQGVADKLRGFHTGFMDVYPENNPASVGQYMSWYIPSRLLDVGELWTGLAAGNQFMQNLLGRLSQSVFFDVPDKFIDGKSPKIVYPIPPRSAPSRIRIVVDRERVQCGRSFYVQFGQEKPKLFYVTDSQLVADNEYDMSPSGAGLGILAQIKGELLYGTLSGLFAINRSSEALVPAQVLVLPLPVGVDTVKIWRGDDVKGPLPVAVQFQAARTFALSETGYYDMLNALGGGDGASYRLFSRVVHAGVNPKGLTRPEKELQNNWLPLIRFLKQQHTLYFMSVNDTPAQDLIKQTLSDQDRDALLQRARILSDSGTCLPAVAAWSQLKHEGGQAVQFETEKRLISALFHLGEGSLAEQECRSLLLTAKEKRLKDWAYQRLKRYYQDNQAVESLVMLTASRAYQHPTIPILQDLAKALLEDNDFRFALWINLILPKADHDVEGLLRAAYQSGWWATYEKTLQELKDTHERAYWAGLLALNRAKYDTALTHFQASGERGKPWIKQIEAGRTILNQILSADVKTRMTGIKAWVRWQFEHPGAFKWQADESIVRDSNGGRLLYNFERDMFGRGFLGSAERPIALEIVGPVKVRLEARLLQDPNDSVPKDGWLKVKAADGTSPFAINASIPAQGMHIIGDEAHCPGTLVAAEFELGPGVHNLTVDAGKTNFLLQSFLARPETPVPILPPLSSATTKAAFYHQIEARKASPLPCLFLSCLWLVPKTPSQHLQSYFGPSYPAVDIMHHATPDKPVPLALAKLMGSVSLPKETRVSGGFQRLKWPTSSGLGSEQLSSLRPQRQRLKREAVMQKLSACLWKAENDQQDSGKALAEASALADEMPAMPQLQPYKARVSRLTDWLLLTQVEQYAGLFYEAERKWEPLSPILQVKKALSHHDADDEQVLFGEDKLVYDFSNAEAVMGSFRLRTATIGSVEPHTATVTYQVDKGDLKTTILDTDSPIVTLDIPMPKGEHKVRFWVKQPVSKQFIAVRVLNKPEEAPIAKMERVFVVATHQKPVTLTVEGPAYIRVDEKVDDEVQTTFRYISQQEERIVLKPGTNQTKAWFRLLAQYPTGQEKALDARLPDYHAEEIPTPYTKIKDSKPAPTKLCDGLEWAGQNKGAWSLSVRPQRRKNFIQRNESNFLTLEDFVKPSLIYRYYSPSQNVFYKTVGFTHIRDHGGPVIGAYERVVYEPSWYPIFIMGAASIYSQNPRGSRWDFTGQNEWAAYFDNTFFQVRWINPMTFHIPSFSWEIRRLSLKTTEDYDPQDIDQSIYTEYNAAHPKLIRLSDVLFHRPFQDTFWYVSGAVISQPNLDLSHPDHYRIRVGWRQLFGLLGVSPEYEYVKYIPEDLLRRFAKVYFDWFKYSSSQYYFRIRGNVTYGIDVPITVGFINFVWNYNNGRQFRDYFEPDAFNFYNLRTRQFPIEPNNYMLGGDVGDPP